MTNNSNNKYIDKVVKRYSKLFGLPSQGRILLYLSVLTVHGGILSILPFNFSLETFIVGLGFGGIFLFFTLISDFILSRTSLRRDPIFNFRRCLALSFFSSFIWYGVLLLGILITIIFGVSTLWIRFIFLGFSGALILRLLVLSITSFVDFELALFSSIFQPVLILGVIFYLGSTHGFFSEMQFLSLGSVSISVVIIVVFIFKYFMDRVGSGSLGIASSVLFKAFLANWTEDVIEPLELFFEKLGNLQDIKVSFLIFRAINKLKGVIVVPALRPGPFKNLGSSLLPSMIQTAIQNKFGCFASVPHGLVGHELDVASQSHTQRVVDHIVGFIQSSSSDSQSTPMIRTESGDAKASCQIFGNCAFITLTTAPKTMEDLPPELNSFIVNEAKKRGLYSLAIDAHNSMGGKFDLETAVTSFTQASVDCLEKAKKIKKVPFKVGTSTILPKDFTVKDGMGSGGINVFVSEVEGNKTAYVTIDGNNMVSGLREKILSSIKELGIDDGEVFTTDTHSVCGLVRGKRGYNLVGEAINHSKLIDHIKRATNLALRNLEPVTVSFKTESISDVKVVGEQQIKELTVLADKTTECVKRVAIILFPVAAILLSYLLLFLL
ncbi:DUF2070 family protein [Candidatus Bathyarchaeota archaeon]|nr:DUF2070 family protein [Candidatus Bathyarchaeota archaeon]